MDDNTKNDRLSQKKFQDYRQNSRLNLAADKTPKDAINTQRVY